MFSCFAARSHGNLLASTNALTPRIEMQSNIPKLRSPWRCWRSRGDGFCSPHGMRNFPSSVEMESGEETSAGEPVRRFDPPVGLCSRQTTEASAPQRWTRAPERIFQDESESLPPGIQDSAMFKITAISPNSGTSSHLCVTFLAHPIIAALSAPARTLLEPSFLGC